MCAIIVLEDTKNFLKANKNRKTVKVYKNLDLIDGELTSPIYSHIWKPGENKSNSRAGLQKRDYTKISKGIHTYLTREEAEFWNDPPRVVVELTAFIEDLIGVDDLVGVFKKVYLSKKEYESVRKSI